VTLHLPLRKGGRLEDVFTQGGEAATKEGKGDFTTKDTKSTKVRIIKNPISS
jgi:hypothetical protein